MCTAYDREVMKWSSADVMRLGSSVSWADVLKQLGACRGSCSLSSSSLLSFFEPLRTWLSVAFFSFSSKWMIFFGF